MKPVDQTQFYEAGKSVGNCQQAATASLLGLDLAEVPNFIEHPHGFWQSFWEFMASRGLVVIELSDRGISTAIILPMARRYAVSAMPWSIAPASWRTIRIRAAPASSMWKRRRWSCQPTWRSGTDRRSSRRSGGVRGRE